MTPDPPNLSCLCFFGPAIFVLYVSMPLILWRVASHFGQRISLKRGLFSLLLFLAAFPVALVFLSWTGAADVDAIHTIKSGSIVPLLVLGLGNLFDPSATAVADKPVEIDEVIMGNVLQAGQGQNPARQAMIRAGLPKETPAFSINKVCGSGMKSVMLGHDAIKAGSSEVVIAGGMESMTNAPYLLPKARSGMRMGHQQALDQEQRGQRCQHTDTPCAHAWTLPE